MIRRDPTSSEIFRSLSYSSAHDDIASIKQSRPYLIVAQYSVDLVPIFLRDRNRLLLLLLLLRWLLVLVSLKAAMTSLPIVGHDGVTPLLALDASRPPRTCYSVPNICCGRPNAVGEANLNAVDDAPEIDKDRQDFTIYSSGWAMGRICEQRGGPD